MKKILRHVIAADDIQVSKIARDLVMKSDKPEDIVDARVRKLVDKYAEDLYFEPGATYNEIVQKNSGDLINWLSERTTIDYDNVPAIINYFANSKLRSMRRGVAAADEIPGGYLGTNKFTCPSCKTDDQRNVVEALEIAITAKFKQFEDFCNRQFALTSDSAWTGKVTQYPEGYYIELTGTRSGFNAFVQDGDVIRKPRALSGKLGEYSIDGNRGTIYWISPFHPAKTPADACDRVDITSSTSIDFNVLKELANKFDKYLQHDGYYVDFCSFNEPNVIEVRVDGDWKEHIYVDTSFNDFLKESGDEFVCTHRYQENVGQPSGGDWYDAIHYYYISPVTHYLDDDGNEVTDYTTK